MARLQCLYPSDRTRSRPLANIMRKIRVMPDVIKVHRNRN